MTSVFLAFVVSWALATGDAQERPRCIQSAMLLAPEGNLYFRLLNGTGGRLFASVKIGADGRSRSAPHVLGGDATPTKLMRHVGGGVIDEGLSFDDADSRTIWRVAMATDAAGCVASLTAPAGTDAPWRALTVPDADGARSFALFVRPAVSDDEVTCGTWPGPALRAGELTCGAVRVWFEDFHLAPSPELRAVVPAFSTEAERGVKFRCESTNGDDAFCRFEIRVGRVGGPRP